MRAKKLGHDPQEPRLFIFGRGYYCSDELSVADSYSNEPNISTGTPWVYESLWKRNKGNLVKLNKKSMTSLSFL